MQGFILQDNQLIKSIDKISKKPIAPSPIKNTFKTIVKRTPFQTVGQNTLYSKHITFNVPREFDNFSQAYIKCTLGNGQVACGVESSFSTKVFKSIVLRTKSGTILQTITPEYSNARLDELYNSSLYTQIVTGVEPSSTFLAKDTITCFVPLFFFFSESVLSFLNTRNLEPLEIDCVVNDTKESMGLNVDITTASYEMSFMYHDENTSNKTSEHIDTIKPDLVPRLISSFDIFQEDSVTCAVDSTSARVLLRCPRPAYVLHCALVAVNSKRQQINTLTLTSANSTIVDLDYRINYSMYSDRQSYLESGTTSYWFSQEKQRTVDSGLITFSGSFFPCYLDVTFEILSVPMTLYVFEEHRTNFKVSPKGIIHLSDDAGFMDQSNSSTSYLSST